MEKGVSLGANVWKKDDSQSPDNNFKIFLDKFLRKKEKILSRYHQLKKSSEPKCVENTVFRQNPAIKRL